MHEQQKSALFKEIWPWLRDAAIIGAIVLAAWHYIGHPVQARGWSMEPTVKDGERLFLDKLSPHWRPYQRGDVVSVRRCNSNESDCADLLKRIIGLPGETVETDNGYVAIDGKPLEEPYVDRERRGGWLVGPTRVPENYYWVMGDSRARSSDSRVFGPVPRESINGRARLNR